MPTAAKAASVAPSPGSRRQIGEFFHTEIYHDSLLIRSVLLYTLYIFHSGQTLCQKINWKGGGATVANHHPKPTVCKDLFRTKHEICGISMC